MRGPLRADLRVDVAIDGCIPAVGRLGRGRRLHLHPDAQFVKINKNNVAAEKDMMTNFKLWWARLFRKSETQPDHLKDKRGKPRYDKGEAGLWYE